MMNWLKKISPRMAEALKNLVTKEASRDCTWFMREKNREKIKINSNF